LSPLEKLKPTTEEVATIKDMVDLLMSGTIGIGQLVSKSAGKDIRCFRTNQEASFDHGSGHQTRHELRMKKRR
jgi:hypothetical protein